MLNFAATVCKVCDATFRSFFFPFSSKLLELPEVQAQDSSFKQLPVKRYINNWFLWELVGHTRINESFGWMCIVMMVILKNCKLLISAFSFGGHTQITRSKETECEAEGQWGVGLMNANMLFHPYYLLSLKSLSWLITPNLGLCNVECSNFACRWSSGLYISIIQHTAVN